MKTPLTRAARLPQQRLVSKLERQRTRLIRALYEELTGRQHDVEGLAYYSNQLQSGRTALDIALELARSPEALRHAARVNGMYLDTRPDAEFISELYREALGREADPSGREWLQVLIKAGASRQSIAIALATSEESLNRQLAQRTHIQNLRELRSESFHQVQAVDGTPIEVFRAASAEDYDWLETAIVEFGYYEKPGIWSLAIDDDKRRMARLLSTFQPRRALELGCSSGAVLECLGALGYAVEGLEISSMAIERAHRSVRSRIHQGDLLELDLADGYDLVFGLDIFEHLNPNRLHRYLDRLAELIEPGGFLFVNSPAFGPDAVWGEIFPLYIPSWRSDVAAGRPFRDLHVDDHGYPQHGHLIWASPQWWTKQFEHAGFRREVRIEQALHKAYDVEFEREAPARKAFFVFSRRASGQRIADVVTRVPHPRREST